MQGFTLTLEYTNLEQVTTTVKFEVTETFPRFPNFRFCQNLK